jgi:hypothetical protein
LSSWGSDPEIVDFEREMEDRGKDSTERVQDKRGNQEAVSTDFEVGYEGTGRENRASREDG